MIAVVCAVPAERRAIAGLGGRIVVHVSGMGATAAARTAAAVASQGPRALLAAGFCGALADDLRVGDLVAADEVVDELTGRRHPADPALLAAAPGRRGPLVSAARIARTRGERARLPGLAVDLESAAVAEAAGAAGVPFLALRAVTDETRHRMPALDGAADASGRLTPRGCATHLARHPGDLPALLRLVPAARTAGRALRDGLAQLLERLR